MNHLFIGVRRGVSLLLVLGMIAGLTGCSLHLDVDARSEEQNRYENDQRNSQQGDDDAQ